MTVNVRFVGGPMDGRRFDIEGLHGVKAFFPPGERRVIAYRRDPMICELCYIYDPALTQGLTLKYDEALSLFNDKEPANLIAADKLKPKPDGVFLDEPKGFLAPDLEDDDEELS